MTWLKGLNKVNFYERLAFCDVNLCLTTLRIDFHCPITTFSESKRFSSFAAKIRKLEDCFLKGQVSSNGFNVFKGCTVEYLNFIGPFTKKENILFSENIVTEQLSPSDRV